MGEPTHQVALTANMKDKGSCHTHMVKYSYIKVWKYGIEVWFEKENVKKNIIGS